MQYFDTIIQSLIARHKDPNTQYGPDQLFPSQNDLSFAISRLMDAQKILSGEYIDPKMIGHELLAEWMEIKDSIPGQTASELALCIIKNTPLSNTEEEINALEQSFYTALLSFTDSEALSEALTKIFFGEKEAKMPRMRDRD